MLFRSTTLRRQPGPVPTEGRPRRLLSAGLLNLAYGERLRRLRFVQAVRRAAPGAEHAPTAGLAEQDQGLYRPAYAQALARRPQGELLRKSMRQPSGLSCLRTAPFIGSRTAPAAGEHPKGAARLVQRLSKRTREHPVLSFDEQGSGRQPKPEGTKAVPE